MKIIGRKKGQNIKKYARIIVIVAVNKGWIYENERGRRMANGRKNWANSKLDMVTKWTVLRFFLLSSDFILQQCFVLKCSSSLSFFLRTYGSDYAAQNKYCQQNIILTSILLLIRYCCWCWCWCWHCCICRVHSSTQFQSDWHLFSTSTWFLSL